MSLILQLSMKYCTDERCFISFDYFLFNWELDGCKSKDQMIHNKSMNLSKISESSKQCNSYFKTVQTLKSHLKLFQSS